jgi:hypothetical protein
MRAKTTGVLVLVALVHWSCGPTGRTPATWDVPASQLNRPESVTPIVPPIAMARPDGFTYCCGNAEFKMAISCDDGIKRCYESTPAGWRQTYGRHCKRTLGLTCNLTTCERMCSAMLSPTRDRG